MNDLYIKMKVAMDRLKDERGQDLIEYALLIAFVAFAATVGMSGLASSINGAFTTIGGDLAGAI